MNVRTLILTTMSIFAFFGCGSNTATPSYPQDIYTTKDGTEVTFTFYAHASIAVDALGHRIYVDPVGDGIAWKDEPEADLVLVTHDHFDHLDTAVVKTLTGTGEYVKMKPGESWEPFDGITVEAVPAYNISEGQLGFHPQERGDVGYVIMVGGSRIYISGDTEDNEDVLSLKDIDVAFVCCNQPYTMTVDQCVRVVKALHPSIFYPYHFGGTDIPTDMDALKSALAGVTEVRVRPLE